MAIKLKNIYQVNFLILWLSISSLFIDLLYNIFHINNNILMLKDLFIYIVLLSGVVIYFHKLKIDKNIVTIFLLFWIIILYNFILSSSVLLSKLATIRQMVTPFVLMYIGYQFTRKPSDYYKILKFIIYLSPVLILFGFVERFSYLWTYISLQEYFEVKSIKLFANGYPIMFIEPVHYFHEAIDVNGIVRMVSTLLDPINYGHSLVAIITAIYYEKSLLGKNKIFKISLLMLSSLALLFTFSKGAWIELFLIFFILNKKIYFLFRLFLIFFLIFAIYIVSQSHTDFIVHALGFISVFKYLTIFGNGLATFGNYASMFAQDNFQITGVGDSFWGSLLGQIGIFGFTVWTLMFISISKLFPKNHYLKRILIAQFIIASISENAFNLLSIYIPMLLIGSYYASLKYQIRNERSFIREKNFNN